MSVGLLLSRPQGWHSSACFLLFTFRCYLYASRFVWLLCGVSSRDPWVSGSRSLMEQWLMPPLLHSLSCAASFRSL